MSQQSSPTKEQSEPKIQATEIASPPKNQKEMKKQKKKKGKALKQFLSKPDGDQLIQVTRPIEEEAPLPESRPENQINCKICGELSQRKKLCQFCKDLVCAQHIRKRRKDKETNKFVRICDDCENRFLYDKYQKTETRAEEALAMQEMIIQGKRDELASLAQNKRTKKKLLEIKRQQIEELRKQNQNRVKGSENEINNKEKKVNIKCEENRIMEDELKIFEEGLPRPLDDDYNRMVQQNTKITKELVKYEKLCSEALKAKSLREKQLYEAYYNWQKKQSSKVSQKKKGEECNIY